LYAYISTGRHLGIQSYICSKQFNCAQLQGQTVDKRSLEIMMEDPSLYFGWVDYLIFTLTLVLSLLIGVYHAWRGAASSTSEYLLGGKSMGIFPIAMSFAARYQLNILLSHFRPFYKMNVIFLFLFVWGKSAVSTQAMLGTPTDVYLTGAMMLWWPVALAIGVPIAAYVYLPLFQDLGVLSLNQVFTF